VRRIIGGPKRNEVTGGWRKLHNEELHKFDSSPSIIRMIKSRRMRWAGNVARIGRRITYIGYWWERQKERDHWEDQDIGGWTILKWILER
jgi:V8-like Glu-specific endopeptidase